MARTPSRERLEETPASLAFGTGAAQVQREWADLSPPCRWPDAEGWGAQGRRGGWGRPAPPPPPAITAQRGGTNPSRSVTRA